MKKRWRFLSAVLTCSLLISNVCCVQAQEAAEAEEPEIQIYNDPDVKDRMMDSTYINARGTVATTYNEGGNHLRDVFGTDYSSVLGWLGQHVNDNYYLGTIHSVVAPNDGDNRNPAGDCWGANGLTDIPGSPVLNCTGFVWHVLYKASGLDHDTAFNVIPSLGGVGAGGWATYLVDHNVEYRTYYKVNNTAADFDAFIDDIVNDGYIEPGDVMWLWDASAGMSAQGLAAGSSPNHHIGIYIGSYFDGQPHAYPWVDGSSENRWWHSFGSNAYTGEVWNQNLTSKVSPGAICNAITVIKQSDTGKWMYNGTGWWWQRYDGSYPANGWEKIHNRWYYFNESGYMCCGWIFTDGTWYYLNSSGMMQRGWIWDGNGWYYLNWGGAMQTGWLNDNGTWYYLNPGNGKMQTYWIFVDGQWYFLDGSGAMQTGWIWDGYNWYYLKPDGAMSVSEWIDGCYVDENGKWIPNMENS